MPPGVLGRKSANTPSLVSRVSRLARSKEYFPFQRKLSPCGALHPGEIYSARGQRLELVHGIVVADHPDDLDPASSDAATLKYTADPPRASCTSPKGV